MTIARVGETTTPVLSADLVRVAAMLRRSADQAHLADRIAAGLAGGGELDLEPRTVAEKTALELVLTELGWEEPRGRLLPRLRAVIADHEVPEPAPAVEDAETVSAADAQRTWRSQIRAARGEIDAGKPRARGGRRRGA
jgi:hypothetical protein